MKFLDVNYSKGQLKIQQMAFVLVALALFFSLLFVLYITLKKSQLEGSAETIREKEVKELVRKLASSPEIGWTITDCASCVDIDKVFAFKESKTAEDLLDLPFVRVRMVYPSEQGECNSINYPECEGVTILDSGEDTRTQSSYVALCRMTDSGTQCTLGALEVGMRSIA